MTTNTNEAPESAQTGDPARSVDIALLEQVREVAVPYSGSNYICPSCEQPIPTRKQIRLSKPARYEHLLNDISKCPFCNYLYSYKTQTAHVISG